MKLTILIIIPDFDWLHILFNIYIYFHPELTIDDFMEYYRTEWPNGSILPKLHMLEDHATDFVERWKTGFGIYGKQGGESIHNEFNQLKLQIAGCSLLQDVLKACCKSITDASIQKAKRLNSKINFVEKGKQPWCIARNWTIASCN